MADVTREVTYKINVVQGRSERIQTAINSAGGSGGGGSSGNTVGVAGSPSHVGSNQGSDWGGRLSQYMDMRKLSTASARIGGGMDMSRLSPNGRGGYGYNEEEIKRQAEAAKKLADAQQQAVKGVTALALSFSSLDGVVNKAIAAYGVFNAVQGIRGASVASGGYGPMIRGTANRVLGSTAGKVAVGGAIAYGGLRMIERMGGQDESWLHSASGNYTFGSKGLINVNSLRGSVIGNALGMDSSGREDRFGNWVSGDEWLQRAYNKNSGNAGAFGRELTRQRAANSALMQRIDLMNSFGGDAASSKAMGAAYDRSALGGETNDMLQRLLGNVSPAMQRMMGPNAGYAMMGMSSQMADQAHELDTRIMQARANTAGLRARAAFVDKTYREAGVDVNRIGKEIEGGQINAVDRAREQGATENELKFIREKLEIQKEISRAQKEENLTVAERNNLIKQTLIEQRNNLQNRLQAASEGLVSSQVGQLGMDAAQKEMTKASVRRIKEAAARGEKPEAFDVQIAGRFLPRTLRKIAPKFADPELNVEGDAEDLQNLPGEIGNIEKQIGKIRTKSDADTKELLNQFAKDFENGIGAIMKIVIDKLKQVEDNAKVEVGLAAQQGNINAPKRDNKPMNQANSGNN